jgi:hypothetical protein
MPQQVRPECTQASRQDWDSALEHWMVYGVRSAAGFVSFTLVHWMHATTGEARLASWQAGRPGLQYS